MPEDNIINFPSREGEDTDYSEVTQEQALENITSVVTVLRTLADTLESAYDEEFINSLEYPDVIPNRLLVALVSADSEAVSLTGSDFLDVSDAKIVRSALDIAIEEEVDD